MDKQLKMTDQIQNIEELITIARDEENCEIVFYSIQ